MHVDPAEYPLLFAAGHVASGDDSIEQVTNDASCNTTYIHTYTHRQPDKFGVVSICEHTYYIYIHSRKMCYSSHMYTYIQYIHIYIHTYIHTYML